ncbi:MAG: hypothetical protein ICV79_04770 [Flavisolibacter sp.]|nr:hypothetical protein [Flavisolibacter sp.]
MKRNIAVAIAFCILSACGESGQGGVVNDGIEPFDSNGALIDSMPNKVWNPSIDSATKGENRVDIQQRGDSAEYFKKAESNK